MGAGVVTCARAGRDVRALPNQAHARGVISTSTTGQLLAPTRSRSVVRR